MSRRRSKSRKKSALSPPQVQAGAVRVQAPLVRIKDLHFSRGERQIFSGINIEIPRGKITAIMGPSGTGKTTLLKLIGGQLQPDQGTVEVDGLDVHRLNTAELYRLRMRMGMLFQSGALL
ncbi:MAG TPA: ATP-binding cassette domain-containing protein, partial [Thiolapillus brandeum]|nr:ATP-binding cassette domain-containing protein [Thiolapillus brandeum]